MKFKGDRGQVEAVFEGAEGKLRQSLKEVERKSREVGKLRWAFEGGGGQAEVAP